MAPSPAKLQLFLPKSKPSTEIAVLPMILSFVHGASQFRVIRANHPIESLRAAEQDRLNVARKREQWRRHQHQVDPTLLVFIDETWAELLTAPRAKHVEGQRRKDQ